MPEEEEKYELEREGTVGARLCQETNLIWCHISNQIMPSSVAQ